MSDSVCFWCFGPATEVVVVQEAAFRTVKGVKKMVQPRREVPACLDCAAVPRTPPPRAGSKSHQASRRHEEVEGRTGVVAAVSESVWGIDVATSHLAFAYAHLDGPVTTETLITRTVEREGARLGLLDRQLRIFARLAAASHPPAVVWVEQPSGRFRNLQLTYACGVIQAALFETLACPVWTIPSSTWKQRTVGSGNATKPQVQAWAEGQGFVFDGEHEADAIGIACAGRAMFAGSSWEATA